MTENVTENVKSFFNIEDFLKGLAALDEKMGENIWLIAFAPIRLISTGGFVSLTYLKSRDGTEDVDYLIDPEHAHDKEIQGAMKEVIQVVSKDMHYNGNWINEALANFVTKKARQNLFDRAEKQNITLYKGTNLHILAAPLEWGVETKLRRIHNGKARAKVETDIVDVVAILKIMRDRNNGPLAMEDVQSMNTNGFDMPPDYRTMVKVADAYRSKHNEDIFK